MPDVYRRALERDAAAGDPQAGVKVLRERMRSGKVTEDQLELAAYCGHEAARVLVCPFTFTIDDCEWEVPGQYPPVTEHDLDEHCVIRCSRRSSLVSPFKDRGWLHGLLHWSHALLVRAAVIAAEAALPVWERQNDFIYVDILHHRFCVLKTAVHGGGGDCLTASHRKRGLGPRLAIRAAHAWLSCPCDEHQEQAREARQLLGATRRFSDAPHLAITGDYQQTYLAIGRDEMSAVCLTNGPTIRKAVCEDLIKMALEA